MKSSKSADYLRGLGFFLTETPSTDAPKHLFRPLFPRLRSGHRLFQRPSLQKQIPSIQRDFLNTVIQAVKAKDIETLKPFSHRDPDDRSSYDSTRRYWESILEKDLHWAMDRQIIAPAPDHRWQVSPLLDARRSNGEQALSELTGKTLLLPKDPAFHPDEKGLEWRVQNLVA